ncbi:rRNA (guanine-N2)-methyltransferase [Halobacteriales archaeon QS_8_69_26]|nr:MAG: rRNA (guanine-N2)-methyltransferase [Halobacteriales archaeon QS_8_69_26]
MPSAPYELRLESRVEPGPSVYEFRTADGVVSKDEFRTAELALLEATEPDPGADVLAADANYGVVPTILAHLSPEGETVATETSARAARLCERNCRANDAPVRVELVADVADVTGEFDLAAYAPRPYDPIAVGKDRVADALAALRSGGRLFVAADRNAGADRYREAMVEVADGRVEGVAKHGDCRVYRAERPPDGSLGRSEYVQSHAFAATVAGVDCEFVTRPGLFSPRSVDDGTALLAETALSDTDLAPDDHLLDPACGYGPLGIAAARRTGCAVTMTDDDRVATACAEESAARSGVDPRIVTADCLRGVDGPFDAALSNPPTHAGEGVTRELFSGTADALRPGGELWLVYNETMRYEDDLPDLGFSSAEVVRRAEGYAVTVARR